MDFRFSDEQEAIRDLARKILGDLVTHERLKEIEAGDERFDRKVWAELAGANLLGIPVPESLGGSGFGFFEVCMLLEEVGRSVAPVPVHPALVLGALPLAEFGSAEQKERLLPRLARGETILTAALAEAGSDDPASPTTEARRDGASWRIEGVKSFVPAAHLAERVLVPARIAGAGVGLFLVDPTASGVTLERQETTNLEPQCRMILSGVEVGADDVVSSPERGEEIVRWITDRAVVGLCALQVGVCDRALRMTAEYTSGRLQFGRPVGSFQAVHQRAGDAYIDAEAIRLTTWQAAWRLASGGPATAETAVAKYWAAEGGHAVTYAAQHLHGGIGVDVDYPLYRYTLWSKQIELSLGSATRHLLRLGELLASEGRGEDGL
jgi:alkylation response protein AidB-like acyl-CoA dehydrogenase